MENTNKRSWFSYCPFASDASRATEAQHDEIGKGGPVIYRKPVDGDSND